MAILKTSFQVTADLLSFLFPLLRSQRYLAAENLFLRKRLAFYQERHTKPGRIDPASKLSLVFLSKLFRWKEAFDVVKPATLIRLHREAFRLFWRWKLKPGRPPVPAELRALIRKMAREKTLCGGRSGSPTSFSSNLVSRSRPGRSGNTC